MTIYQVYQIERKEIYHYDNLEYVQTIRERTLLKSFLSDDKAKEFILNKKRERIQKNEDATFCGLCPIWNMSKRKMNYENNINIVKEYCAEKKEEGFYPNIISKNNWVECLNCKKSPDYTEYEIDIIEVEE